MNDWIEWVYTPEKPYPETYDTVVEVKLRNGLVVPDNTVEWWGARCKSKDASSWYQPGNRADIIAYRVMK